MQLFGQKREKDPCDSLAANGIYPSDLRRLAFGALILGAFGINNAMHPKPDVDLLTTEKDNSELGIGLARSVSEGKTSSLVLGSIVGGTYHVEFSKIDENKYESGDLQWIQVHEENLTLEKDGRKIYHFGEPAEKGQCIITISSSSGKTPFLRAFAY